MEIRTIVDEIYGENCYIVTDTSSGKCAVIDPASPDVVPAVEGLGLKVACVLLTHGHFDHISEVDHVVSVYGAPVYIHENDAELLSNAMKNASAPLIGTPTLVGTQPLALCDGAKITVGELVFEVLHTPGHTEGCVCYFCGDAVFTGDTLFADGYGRTDLYGSNYRKLIDSIHSLLPKLAGKTIYPGHGAAKKF